MNKLNRRSMLQLLGAAPVAAGFTWTDAEAAQAAKSAQAARPAAPAAGYQPKFFTAHEWATVHLLVDMIIPKDDRSGGATDAGVPEFIDFMMNDDPTRRTAMRGGLAWLDLECTHRFDKTFLDASATERAGVLDDISWPTRPKPEFSQGTAFFTSLRNLTASGFFSSKMGVADLKYMGNDYIATWTGCPDAVLTKLGVK